MTLHRTVRSPVFLVSLALLLANDLYLKAQFGNWFTGKLSDFAGLVAFALFWSAVFPRRGALVHILVGVAFVLWKLPLTDPALTLWNSLSPLDFARVTDLTDLMALGVLPLSFYHFRQLDLRGDRIAVSGAGALLKTTAVCTVALFAFVATSSDPGVYFDDEGSATNKYPFDVSSDQVEEAVHSLFQVTEGRGFGVRYESNVCSESAVAWIALSASAVSERTELQLRKVSPGECDNLAEECTNSRLGLAGRSKRPSKDCLRQEFQELVIHPLQAYLASPPGSDAPD